MSTIVFSFKKVTIVKWLNKKIEHFLIKTPNLAHMQTITK